MKKPHSVGYFSSYDRGLRCLLEMWPQLLKEVPDATLDIYYGWNTYDKMYVNNPVMMKQKWDMVRLMSPPSISEHGRVSYKELAQAMKGIKVWAYPTEFSEINCITALKTQEAGMIPVTTDCYALETSVINKDFSVKCLDIYTNKAKQAEFIEKLVLAINFKGYEAKNIKLAKEDWYWPNVAKKWHQVLM